MKTLRILLATATSLAITVGTAAPAQANLVEFIELRDGVHRQICLHPSVRTGFNFPERILHYSLGITSEYDHEPDRNAWKWVEIQPAPHASATNVNFETVSAWVVVSVALTCPQKEATRMVIFYEPGHPALESIPEPPWIKSEPNTETPNIETRNIETRNGDEILLEAKLREKAVLDPVNARFQSQAHTILLETSAISISDIRMCFGYQITNDGKHPYPLDGLALRDHLRSGQYMLRQYPGELPKTLKPGQTITGVIVADSPEHLRQGFALELLTGPGVVPAILPWEGFSPKPPRPPRHLHKLAIGAQALTGAIRLNNDAGENKWARVSGVGVRTAYGVYRHLSVEGAVDYIATGEAAFDAGAAHLTGGRAQANALLHFGDKIVPYFRLGVGVIAGSQSTDNGDSVFRFEVVGNVGVGIDAWLGKNFVVGLSGTGTAGALTSAEVEAHLAYAVEL